MSNFKLVGFNHVKPEGVAALCCRMDSEGTISMLWDMTNQSIIDTLMGEKDWDMTQYIEGKCNVCKEEGGDQDDCDNIHMEVHDELVDAKFGLMYAFCNNLKEVILATGRAIYGIDEVTVSDCWNPTSYYPRAELIRFDDWKSLGDFCCEHLGADLDEITVRITAKGDGMSDQDFNMKISGAQEYNMLEEFEAAMREVDYTEFTYTRIN